MQNDIAIKEKFENDEKVAAIMEDASITAQVKYSLFNHKSTRAMKTSVSTIDRGVVIGCVAKSDAVKSLVGKLAKDIRGAIPTCFWFQTFWFQA
ncbi:hypothetical protein [Pelagicoccus sp. SDUM812003]|uniref:hypothetical protein n=1 Tax=Pelagicoccus sp. SDUM812003 TaxID=3041267 RepID=UPI002810082F|nr:hypothetical protein [Pelagicoccus sp. SDUM812003]MDQ8204743.1 hypothetical protein [Pelagicoccus sp. SDUM812003]